MDLGITKKVAPLIRSVREMIENEIAPLNDEYFSEVGKHPTGNRFLFTKRQTTILEGLKDKARSRNLWNFWLTDSEKGYGLSTVEYAYLAEEMGKVAIAAETFNCSAPDTGNMEVLERYGSKEHKQRWLVDLLDGKIRSAYVMTEPSIASSDAVQLEFSAKREGNSYLLNGEKWWISGAGDPRCALYILMANTNPSAPRHNRHTMFAIDAALPGIEIVRAMKVFDNDDAPHGHMHLRFTDVRVPVTGVILGEGRGFEVAQGRLGPGRIHHCMRAIGQAEKALEMMCRRGLSRTAFGKPLTELGANYDIIANARMDIEMARLLCLKAAYMMDTAGVRAAQPWISKIKVVAPLMAGRVIDESMQMHGAGGISQDFHLAHMWTHVRTLRFADGPDAVHRRQVARAELKKYTNAQT